MKRIRYYAAIVFLVVSGAHADIKVTGVKGDVYVRHNVQEGWTRVAVGDVLKPEDSMKLEKKSSATILVDGKNKLALPELVIIDLSDLRALTQEELLLGLAMERVRNTPGVRNNDELHIPVTTTVHGENKDQTAIAASTVSQTLALQLNGTHVLYDKGFYATCVLKTKEILRQYPDVVNMTDARLMIATALEKMKLKGEALSEYLNIPKANLSSQQRAVVESKIDRLKSKSN